MVTRILVGLAIAGVAASLPYYERPSWNNGQLLSQYASSQKYHEDNHEQGHYRQPYYGNYEHQQPYQRNYWDGRPAYSQPQMSNPAPMPPKQIYEQSSYGGYSPYQSYGQLRPPVRGYTQEDIYRNPYQRNEQQIPIINQGLYGLDEGPLEEIITGQKQMTFEIPTGQEFVEEVQFGPINGRGYAHQQRHSMFLGGESIDDLALGQQQTHRVHFDQQPSEDFLSGQQQTDDVLFGNEKVSVIFGQQPVEDIPFEQSTGMINEGQQQTMFQFGQKQIDIFELGQQQTDDVEFGQQQTDDVEFGQQQTDNVEFGQQQTDDIEFGQQQTDNVEFGQQQTDNVEFGQQQTDNVEFGKQQTDNVEFGQQQTDNVEFGQQQTDDVEFGQQQTDDVEFGQKQTDDAEFGQQQTDDVEFGQKQTDNVEFGHQQTENLEFGQQQTDEVSFDSKQFKDLNLGQEKIEEIEFSQKEIVEAEPSRKKTNDEFDQKQFDNIEYGQRQIDDKLLTLFGQEQTDHVDFGQQETSDLDMALQTEKQVSHSSPEINNKYQETRIEAYYYTPQENELDEENFESKKPDKMKYYGNKWQTKKSQDKEKYWVNPSKAQIYSSVNEENRQPVVEEEIQAIKVAELGLEEGKAGRYKVIEAFLSELENELKQADLNSKKHKEKSRVTRQSNFEDNFSSEEKDTGFWDGLGKKIKTTYEKAKDKTKEIYEDVKDKIKGDDD